MFWEKKNILLDQDTYISNDGALPDQTVGNSGKVNMGVMLYTRPKIIKNFEFLINSLINIKDIDVIIPYVEFYWPLKP